MIKLNCEEEFLINLITNSKNTEKLASKLNTEKLVKISSRSLLLPLLYYMIIKKKLEIFFPKDFINYCRQIYEINYNRNVEFINEINELISNLSENKIDFTLIKSSDLIINGIYEDIGIRMIGDIDYLISSKDFELNNKILKKLNYKSEFYFKFWKARHLNIFLNEKKFFRIEPHVRLIDDNISLNKEAKKIELGLKSKNNFSRIKYCILNSEYNDFSMLRAVVDLRVISDLFILMNNKTDELSKIEHNFIYRRFLLKLGEIGLYKIKFEPNFLDKIYLLRFRIKRRNKLVYKFDESLINLMIFVMKLKNQIREFIYNSEYRKYIFYKKLFFKIF
tara:strand:+ start:369 stop:1373 length:1005 start_codon:yes stop_codon:yes gene_type:complete